MQFLNNYYWDRFIHNKFNHLLSVLLLSFVINPIFDAIDVKLPIMSVIFLLTIILTLRAVIDDKKVFSFFVALSSIAFVFQILVAYRAVDTQSGTVLALLALVIFIIFFILLIFLLIQKIAGFDQINADTIKGGICVYLLIGLLWSLFYQLVYLFDKTAFSKSPLNFSQFQYFSFTVLTTLGFGDIAPVNPLATNLTSLEAIAGQMFLAIFIARLVALHLTQNKSEEKNAI